MRVRVVSDLHVGSYWGLLPPNFEYDGQLFPQNAGQLYLWACWQHMLNGPAPDVIIVNGDTIDGEQRKSGGTGVISPHPEIQLLAAIQALAPLLSMRRWWCVRGTPFHEDTYSHLGDVLGAEKWPNGANHGWVLDLEVNGVRINCAHHPESGSVLYRGTALDKQLLWSVISGALENTPHADVIIRSHHHHFGLLRSNHRTVVATPAWQLQSPYATKLGYYRMQPSIGFVDLVFTGDPTHPVHVEEHLYALPRKETIRLESADSRIQLADTRTGTPKSTRTDRAARRKTGGTNRGRPR